MSKELSIVIALGLLNVLVWSIIIIKILKVNKKEYLKERDQG